ncbi:hypothetical protein Dda_1564 [Drechslerella dactyloides]|uniref:Uncharacterized protein n=1 Tax=Drechslerella dactyloides TaxID=74499 RepID=A0AAD6NKR4_DREDA|nr:hypothetical protein Dda_1564 [Drechslerella dactyloides]
MKQEIETAVKARMQSRPPQWLSNHPDAPLPPKVLEWYIGRPSLLRIAYETPNSISNEDTIAPASIRKVLGHLTQDEFKRLHSVLLGVILEQPELLELNLAQNPIHNNIFCSHLTKAIAEDPGVIDGIGFWEKVLIARLKRRQEVEWALYVRFSAVMASSNLHTPSAVLPARRRRSQDYDAKGRPLPHIWGEIIMSAELDKPLPTVPFKTKDSTAFGEFSIPPPPLRRRSWSHRGEEFLQNYQEPIMEDILMDDLRGRTKYRHIRPPPEPVSWQDIQRQSTVQHSQSADQEDAASDDSVLTTIWIPGNIEERRAQSLPPLPPRKDEWYRRKQINSYWRMFRKHILKRRDSTPSSQGMNHPLPGRRTRSPWPPPEEEEPITVKDWIIFSIVMLFLGSYLVFIIWVGHQKV